MTAISAFRELKRFGEVPSSRGATIRVSLVQAGGRAPYLDIRRWEQTDRYEGPTPKGVTFDPKQLSALIEILTVAAKDFSVQ